ncbi:DNA helicase, putative [Babesia caballi]|uniref:DNA helicase, putative n=1 Tax=Babesia caballi TaxID=5871 RepID=A0AAV4LNP3_BABCB|nr:DNA helicase, putative [Babesia caballi]
MTAGKAVFVFGKHKGKTFEDVYRSDAGYTSWALQIEAPTGQMLQFCNYARSVGGDAAAKTKQNEGTSPSKSSAVTPVDSRVSAPSAPAADRGAPKANGAVHAPVHQPTPAETLPSRVPLHSETLGSCLDAKWRRLTQKAEDADEEEERHQWPLKRSVTSAGSRSILHDDSTTLRHVYDAVVAAKRFRTPSTLPQPREGASGAATARSTADVTASISSRLTLTSAINRKPEPTPTKDPLVPPQKAPLLQTTLDATLSPTRPLGAPAPATKGPAPSKTTLIGAAYIDTKGAAPVKPAQPTGGPASAAPTNAGANTMAAPRVDMSPEKVKLNIEGLVALVLHSEMEFHVTYQKQVKDNYAVWTSALPPPLFDFLRSVDQDLRTEKANKQSFVVIAANKYDVVLRALKGALVRSKCAIDPIPNFILRTFPAFKQYAREEELPEKTVVGISGVLCRYTSRNIDRLPDLVGQELYSQLRPFQREGVKFGVHRNGRVLIGDEMGLGKTLQALAISAFYQEDWPLLIVCPSSLRFQWHDQCERWLAHLVQPHEICTVKNGKTAIPDLARIIIISYDLYTLNEHFQHGFRIVICDESHYLKNGEARRTRCLVPLLKSAERVILLSGTPTLNAPSELYEQVSCILPGFCSNHTFLTRYCQKKLNFYSNRMSYSGSQHTLELHHFMVRTVMIRRLKDAVLKELPPKVRSRVPIELPAKFLRETKQALSEEYRVDGEPRASMQEVFRLTGEAKVKAVCEYISHLLQSSVKFIIFAHHRSVLDAIEATLKQQSCNYMRIDGSTSQSKREDNVRRFQADDKCRVALLSLTACGVGLNLTASSTVVFAELHWVPGQMIQAEDRAHRMGTKHRVIDVHYLIAVGSVEETVWQVVNRKWSGVTSTLDGRGSNLVLTRDSEKLKIKDEVSQMKITELIE